MGKSRWWLIVLTVLCLTGCLRISTIQAKSGDKIRVLVSKGARELNIKSSDRGALKIVRTGPGTAEVNGDERSLPLRVYPKDKLVYINNRPYRGFVDILEGKGGLMAVNELYIESYLVGIINNEISSRWPAEVIKAQAVVARTYALFQKGKRLKEPYHVEGTVMGQVYTGTGKEDSTALKAVRETSGEILTYGGEPALTVYHSNAGGMTESSRNVWSRYYPYLSSVKSPYDSGAPMFNWEFSLTADSLQGLLGGYGIGQPQEIETGTSTEAGRVKTLYIRDDRDERLKLTGEDLRRAVGYDNLRSTMFEVYRDGDVFVFKGRGSGHGVGLSQWGAKGMAEDGYSYREILRHYYPGTDLERAY